MHVIASVTMKTIPPTNHQAQLVPRPLRGAQPLFETWCLFGGGLYSSIIYGKYILNTKCKYNSMITHTIIINVQIFVEIKLNITKYSLRSHHLIHKLRDSWQKV